MGRISRGANGTRRTGALCLSAGVDVEKAHEIPAVRDVPDITEVTREMNVARNGEVKVICMFKGVMLETPPEAIFL
ncbi:MAG: hypothetical protein LBU25_06000 [Treponema sp.]|nr:hypothetical protein [Treponema sp.]